MRSARPPIRLEGGIAETSLAGGRASGRNGYLPLLAFLLFGYAALGKGFAYLGVPPLYVGEIVLAVGCIVLLRTGCGLAILSSPAILCLVALMLWAILRSAPFVSTYGIDVPRDAMVVIYGLFALIVAAILLERPGNLNWMLGAYREFARFYGYLGGLLFPATSHLANMLPSVGGVTLPYVRAGEAAVHLAGAAIFAAVGLMRVSALWIVMLFGGVLLISPSRGATLAFVAPLVLAVVVTGRAKRFAPALLFAAGAFCLALMTGIEIPLPGGERSVGAEQIVERVASIFGQSRDAGLDGTKQWRLRWWGAIRDYTINGPYFWTGKGFGVNLAIDDNFMVGEAGGVPLRSPHNAHLTILARSGVPGMTLWILALTLWYATLASAYLRARRRGDETWAALFVWVGCYALASLINASFDVALEGPMQGIWFWSLFGLGAGMAMVYGVSVRLEGSGWPTPLGRALGRRPFA